VAIDSLITLSGVMDIAGSLPRLTRRTSLKYTVLRSSTKESGRLRATTCTVHFGFLVVNTDVTGASQRCSPGKSSGINYSKIPCVTRQIQ
jgi:hypothetical protein